MGYIFKDFLEKRRHIVINRGGTMNDIFILLFGIIAVMLSIRFVPYILRYNKSEYKNESGISMIKYLTDTGCFGEALIFLN